MKKSTALPCLYSMPSFAATNGGSMGFIIGNTPEDCEKKCRECKNIIMCGSLCRSVSFALSATGCCAQHSATSLTPACCLSVHREGDLRLGKGSWTWVEDEADNFGKGSWRCFDTCVDDGFMSDVLGTEQDGQAFALEKLAGFGELDADDKKKVTERFEAAAAIKGEVDAAKKQERKENREAVKAAIAEKAAKKAEKDNAKKLARTAAKKGQLTVSSAGGSGLVPCTKCGEHISKANFAHECKKQPAHAMSFFGGAGAKSKSAVLAAAAAAAKVTEKEEEAAAADKAAEKKAAKKRKDPNAPRGAKSAYIFYSTEKRPEMQAAHPEMKMTELSKPLGAAWKEMSEEDKAPYEAQAAEDKVRVTAEKEAYDAPGGGAEKFEAAQEAADAEEVATKKRKEAEGAAGPAKKKKRVKEVGEPKRPMTSYLFFTASARPEITAANPELKMTELAPIFSEKWKTLTEEEKAPFIAQAEADKTRYAEEMEEFARPEAKAAREAAAVAKAAEVEAEADEKAAAKAAKKAAAPKKKSAPKKKPTPAVRAPVVYVTMEACGCEVRQGFEWGHTGCTKNPANAPLATKTPLRDLFKSDKEAPAVVYVTMEACGCEVRQGFEWGHTGCTKTPASKEKSNTGMMSPPGDMMSPPASAADTAMPMVVE